MKELKDKILEYIIINNLDEAIIEMSFVQKKQMIEYKPQISNKVKMELINLIFKFIEDILKTHKIVEYNPMGVLDYEIEYLDINTLKESDYSNKFFDTRTIIKEDKFNPEKIDYYEIKFKCKNKTLRLYRQFKKMKKLRKGLFTRLLNNELNVLEGDIIAIDGNIDLLIFDSKILAFNHIALERILNFKDIFYEETKKALNKLRNSNIIENIDQFEIDCLQDSRLLKRFTSIMSEDKLPLFIKNFNKVPQIVQELNLDLKFNNNGQIIYNDKNQLYHIVYLMSDAYFKSLLAERKGVAIKEGKL